MKYELKTSATFDKDFKRLDKYTQRMILYWIQINLQNIDDPRIHGKPLIGNHKGKWRYRIGDYRLLCSIEDAKLIILAISIGHRKEIYNK